MKQVSAPPSMRALARDIIGVVGGVLFVAGVAWISGPAALIVAGLLMMGAAWLLARADGAKA